MKKTLLTIALIATMAAGAKAATLLAWDFTGASSNATLAATSVDSTDLDTTAGLNTLSRGSTAAASAGNNSFRTTGFKNDGISTSNTDYFQFSLSGTTGTTISFSTLDAKFGGTTSYSTAGTPSQIQFAYSLNGTTFTLIGSPTSFTSNALANAGTSISLSGISALQNVADTSTVYFRLYATGATTTGGFGFYSASGGTIGLDAIGTVASVPEPATIGLLGFGLGMVIWKFRRSKSLAAK